MCLHGSSCFISDQDTQLQRQKLNANPRATNGEQQKRIAQSTAHTDAQIACALTPIACQAEQALNNNNNKRDAFLHALSGCYGAGASP